MKANTTNEGPQAIKQRIGVPQPATLPTAVAGALPAGRPTLLALLGTLSGAAALGLAGAAHAANTYFVNTAGDPGPGGTLSLRQAVALATQNADSDTVIRFDDTLVGSTITLAQGAIVIEQGMSIEGFDDRSLLTISGADAGRIFEINDAFGVFIRDLTLTHGHSSGCGGALYAKGNEVVVLLNVAVTDSSAFSGGGLCAVSQATLSLSGCRISGNEAAFGGGLYAGQSASYLSVGLSTISGNSALRAGGAMYLAGVERAGIALSLIAANSVPPPAQYSYPSHGGGIVAAGIGSEGFRIAASTIAGNSSYAAGSALRILDATSGDRTRLINATIANNTSATGASAISSAGSPVLTSTIVANNAGGDLAGTFTANFSLIKNPVGAQIAGDNNLLGIDPQLGPLADHGGPTFCMLPAAGSPVLGAGHLNPVPGQTALDQRLYAYVGKRSIGAVERQDPEDIVFRNGLEPL